MYDFKRITPEDFSKLRGVEISFSFMMILASTSKLHEVFGKPQSYYPCDTEKVTRVWYLSVNDVPFTIYDWKEYRVYGDKEEVWFHIGSRWTQPEDKKVIAQALRAKGLTITTL